MKPTPTTAALGTWPYQTPEQKEAVKNAIAYTDTSDNGSTQAMLEDKAEYRARVGVSARSSCNGFARGFEFETWTKGGV